MRTVVLDDDPTGTQSASGVAVLLECDADLLTAALTNADSVYVQTNSRAISEPEAVALVASVRDAALAAGRRLGEDIQFVLRGDSTLRGHVFAESAVFATPDSVLLFVPAFPDGGRTTRDGIHYAVMDGVATPAAETEYADDPVFGFGHSAMTDYVAEKTGSPSLHVPLDEVRSGGLADRLMAAPAGSVVTCDAVSNPDIVSIAEAVRNASAAGRRLVIRSAAPLAAELAGVASSGLLPRPLVDAARPTLLVCGSHTAGATAQLAALEAEFGAPVEVDTDAALADPVAAGEVAAAQLRGRLASRGFAMLASQRERRPEHNTLAHGERVMAALTHAVAALADEVEVVVSKGGITSAEVVRTGLGVTAATVLGQVLPGVSVWSIAPKPGRSQLYVVVPGNVGGANTLQQVLAAVRLGAA
ncbi:MAG: four-carbon acid sugar kinase family protein [Propionicimonas sp.]